MKNKIKGSVAFITPAKLGIAYAVSLVICIALRIYHVFSLIEPQTGFYSDENFTVTLFYAVLAISCVFIAVGAYLSRDIIDISDKTVNGNGPVGIVSLFLSAGFFLDFGYCLLMTGASQEENYAYGSGPSASPFSIMMRSGSLPRKAEMIFALLAFIYFAVFAIMVLTKRYKGQMKLLSLSAVFWGISKLVTLFVRQISFVQVSDLFLEIAATACLTIFFFSLCESLGGVYKKDAQWRVIGLGLPASLCCLTVQIPRFIAAFIDGSHSEENGYLPYIYNQDYAVNYAMIIIGVLALVLFLTLRKKTVSQSDT